MTTMLVDAPPSALTSAQVAEKTGATYRQLDYWAGKGYVHPRVTHTGSGYAREWSPVQVLRVRVILTLLRAGLSLEQAARIAGTDRPGDHELADGVTVTVPPSVFRTV